MVKCSDYLKIACFVILFAWISFVPQPMQERYIIFSRVFFAVFLLVLALNGKSLKRLFGIEDMPLWLMLAAMSANMINAADKTTALNTYVYIAATFIIFFYIGKSLSGYENGRKAFALTVCICGFLTALAGLAELYYGKNILYINFISNPYYQRYSLYSPRPMSTQFNPSVLGSFLLGCLPFSFYFLKARPFYIRLAFIISFLVCAFVLILTFSRGVFLGLIFSMTFYLWKSRGVKSVIGFVLLIISAITVCSFNKDININRFGFKRFICGSYDSIVSEYRSDRVKMAFEMFKDYPLTGVGFNNFRIRFREYCAPANQKEMYEFMIPDNMYLTLPAESGIAATLGFAVFIFVLIRRGLLKLKLLRDENKGMFLLILLASLIGLLVNMAAYELFYWHNQFVLFCLLCGFVQGIAVEKVKDGC